MLGLNRVLRHRKESVSGMKDIMKMSTNARQFLVNPCARTVTTLEVSMMLSKAQRLIGCNRDPESFNASGIRWTSLLDFRIFRYSNVSQSHFALPFEVNSQEPRAYAIDKWFPVSGCAPNKYGLPYFMDVSTLLAVRCGQNGLSVNKLLIKHTLSSLDARLQRKLLVEALLELYALQVI